MGKEYVDGSLVNDALVQTRLGVAAIDLYARLEDVFPIRIKTAHNLQRSAKRGDYVVVQMVCECAYMYQGRRHKFDVNDTRCDRLLTLCCHLHNRSCLCMCCGLRAPK